MNVVDYIGRDDILGGIFKDSMKQLNLIFKEILEIYTSFEGLCTLVDVGGGNGIEHIAGDMFVRIPEGEAIFMKWILHGWDDDRCLMILRICYKALLDNEKVIVVDMVIQKAPETSLSAKSLFLLDVYLMNTNAMG
ncbi:caffeic acid 3-O-methyltransferase-like [Pyrus communis]|uniref:caffeic acid 3-O-methyltransferase-like n=1 Tax=Pyrus communis TaxID=23211 RepID=UPI0035C1D6DA